MKSLSVFFVVLLCSLNVSIAGNSFPVDELLATPVQLRQLRAGGYVLFIRHGTTDNSRADRSPSVDLNDCSTQRVLSKQGEQMMSLIGKQIKKAGIPIGDIIVSPLCRTKDSARLLFHSKFTEESMLMYSSNMTSEEKVPVMAFTRKLLSTPVPEGRNRVLVAHAPNLMDLMDYFPKEGTLVIFKPQGNNEYEYIASITPSHWKALNH